MDQYNMTGSVSDRHGWEWNRTYGDAAEDTSSHPRKFAPERYGGSGDRGIREPDAGRAGPSDSRERDCASGSIAGITEQETVLGGDANRGEPDPDTLRRELAELREEIRRTEQRRDAIIRQYERCLAEKNRQLADQSSTGSGEGIGGQGADLVSRLLDPLRK